MADKKIGIMDPLYLHPSDGPHTVNIEKLQGAANYRCWRRTMEISLAAKRKLGFVTGVVKRDAEDAQRQDQWDTCDNIVISWLHGSMIEAVRTSVLYLRTSRDIWVQLESRFKVTHGSRKYKLSKEMYDTKQDGTPINDYYTRMRALWEEFDALNHLPPITTLTEEINEFVGAMNNQLSEQRLFQFLNRVDEDYNPQRSQLLMRTPLPTVEEACASLIQEEAQKEVLNISKLTLESSAMYNKNNAEGGCTVCGGKNHGAETCWHVVGFLKNHPKNRQPQKKPRRDGNKWSKARNPVNRMAANVQDKSDQLLTTEQIQQVLKLLPSGSGAMKNGSDTEEEIDTGFTGMIACCNVAVNASDWIIDSGASNHMASNLDILVKLV